MMAQAIDAVQQHYGFDVPEHYAIWINLVTAFGAVYVPRVVSISSRRSRERKTQEKPRDTYAPNNSGAVPSPKPTDAESMVPTFTLPGMHAPIGH